MPVRRLARRWIGIPSAYVISGVNVMEYMTMRMDRGMGRKCLFVGAIAGFLSSIPAAPAQSADFNPAYPRIAARPHGTLVKKGAIDADSRHIAKHHVAILATHRTWRLDGFDMATLPAHIKSYNSQIKLIKYMNANQLDPGAQDWITKKLYAESGGGGRGDWWKRTTSGNHITGFGKNKYQINVSLQTKPDKAGLQWPQWFARYWNAAPKDSGSWVAPAGYNKGRGLREGDWDGVFQDGQYIQTSVYAPANADYDEDSLNDPRTNLRTRNWVVEGQTAVVNEWRKLQPSRFVIGQYGNLTAEAEPDPMPFKGVHDGGMIQDITKYDGQKGGWPKMMRSYRRGMTLAGDPKIVIFHNKIKDLLDKNSDMNVLQANRYGLTSALMDNGYYAVFAPAQLHPEYDEFYGGKVHSAAKLGYLGYPKNPPQTKPWSNGVYRREFDKGLVLVNPKGNGTRTVSVGSNWKRIDGGQDRTVNNGQNVSSVTLKEQDGIILLRR
jgi:hypothetical protein